MLIGLLKEKGDEPRVALTPPIVAQLKAMSVDIYVESQCGLQAYCSDQDYLAAGAEIKSQDEILEKADLLIGLRPPDTEMITRLRKEVVWLSLLNPYASPQMVTAFQQAGLTAFGMDMIPRTTRAQAMDVLSSMATVSGYKAVILAALELPRFFPMFMTAAGTITPARVMVLGAGVAGLQALATARKLGAVVEVFDVRAAVKEEVLSLGGKFIEVEGALDDRSAGGYAVEQSEAFLQRQAAVIHEHAVKSDIIICTAQIPGKKAPLLIRTTTVESMRAGSVIIDLAASTGGNCELTKDNETLIHSQVKIIGNSNLTALMASDASSMFARNVFNFLKLLITADGGLSLNFNDDIVKGTCLTHEGQLVHENVKKALNL
jgi:NAD(P) transhydrogenase subunit alpha